MERSEKETKRTGPKSMSSLVGQEDCAHAFERAQMLDLAEFKATITNMLEELNKPCLKN